MKVNFGRDGNAPFLKHFSDKHKNVLLLISAFAILSFTPLALLSVLFLIVGFVITIPLPTSRLLPRLLISFITFYTLAAVIAAIFWVLRVDGLPYILALIHLLFGFFILRFKPQLLLKPQIDIIGILVALLIFTIPLLPYVKDPSLATLLQLFSYQGDNTSHLELIQANVQQKGYVYYSLEDIRPYAYQTLSGYPQGWHINAALIQDTIGRFSNINISPHKQLLYFQMYTGLFYAAFAAICYELMLLLSKTRRKNEDYSTLVRFIAGGTVVSLLLGVFMTLYAYGFQTQIASLFSLICILYILSKLYSTEFDNRERFKYFVFSAFLGIGLTYTWQVLSIPLAIGMLAMLPSLLKNYGLRKSWKAVTLLAIITVGAFFQFYIIFRFGNDATTLTQPGLSPEPSEMTLIALLAGTSILALISGIKFQLTPVVAFITGTFSFSAILYSIMEIQIGEQRYYYYKTTFTLIVLCVILASAMFIALADKKLLTLPKHNIVLVIPLVLVFVVAISTINASTETKKYLDSTLQGMDRPLSEVLAKYIADRPESRASIIAVGSCIPDQDYKATRIAQALSMDTRIKTYYASTPYEKPPDYTANVRRFSELKPNVATVIISHDQNVLNKIIAAKNPSINLIGINVDPNGPPKDPLRCPNFIDFKKN